MNSAVFTRMHEWPPRRREALAADGWTAKRNRRSRTGRRPLGGAGLPEADPPTRRPESVIVPVVFESLVKETVANGTFC